MFSELKNEFIVFILLFLACLATLAEGSKPT
jgi:hypothetical protein